jgi:hypothetical protein
MIYDSTFFLLIPAIIISMYAQQKIQSTFAKYSRAYASSSMTGYDVARMILDENNLQHVKVEHVKGNLTDHYDPRTKVLRLSDSVFGSKSIAAYGVAAHEVGHAIQHANSYAPLQFRNSMAPVVGFSSKFSWILILAGLFLGAVGLLQIGIFLFSAIVLFQLVTLPVEFNASNRAIAQLEGLHFLKTEELGAAKKVLDAAALTYVAAALTSVSQLIRLLMLANRRR